MNFYSAIYFYANMGVKCKTLIDVILFKNDSNE
jgi:hypothetical protein